MAEITPPSPPASGAPPAAPTSLAATAPTPPADAHPSDPIDEPFDQLLARVEDIMKRLEGGKLPLEEAVRQFQEGSMWLRKARERLEGLERQVEVLIRPGGDAPAAQDE